MRFFTCDRFFKYVWLGGRKFINRLMEGRVVGIFFSIGRIFIVSFYNNFMRNFFVFFIKEEIYLEKFKLFRVR